MTITFDEEYLKKLAIDEAQRLNSFDGEKLSACVVMSLEHEFEGITVFIDDRKKEGIE